jgi:hypothetical protein
VVSDIEQFRGLPKSSIAVRNVWTFDRMSEQGWYGPLTGRFERPTLGANKGLGPGVVARHQLWELLGAIRVLAGATRSRRATYISGWR